MRILLVQPPFWGVNSPSIGLSYLRAALRDAGLEADIFYSNLDYANLIGRELYGIVQTQLPVDLLFGDLVFIGMYAELINDEKEINCNSISQLWAFFFLVCMVQGWNFKGSGSNKYKPKSVQQKMHATDREQYA